MDESCRYKVLRQLGDGTYGSVWKAVNRKTGDVVAIKRMKRKFFSWEECLFLREVRSLRKLRHPCIVKLNEVIRENNELFFIFEYLDYNLYQVMKQRKGKRFTEAQVRDWMFQILQGLAYMHSAGFFHRDLKPENLLVHGDGDVKVVKIADFGLAREIASDPPYTEYVSTRWYRAPEVLFRAPKYSAPVDLFAVGAIMAELFTLKPLFPGATEFDEIMKIRIVIGSFTPESWPEGEGLLQQTGFQLGPIPDQSATCLANVISEASPEALDLIAQLVQWDPSKRPTAAQALAHPFFRDAAEIPRPATPPILPEKRAKALIGVTSQKPILMMRKDSKKELRRESSGKRLAADLSKTRHDPKAAPAVRASRKIDYNPMKSSIRISERQRRATKPHKGRQSLERVRGGQPPDLWVNAQGVAKAKQHAGFSQIERGAPMGATIKPNPWLPKLAVQAPFGSSGFSAQPMIPAHRKAVPVREKVGPSKALRTSEASLTSLQQTLNSRLMNDSPSCRLHQLQGSTLEANRYAPLSASMAQWDESSMPALRRTAANMAKAA